MVEYSADQRRKALDRFMKVRGLNKNAWAKKSGVAESTLRNFIEGRSESMTDKTWQKLAHGADVQVSDILSGDRLPADDGVNKEIGLDLQNSSQTSEGRVLEFSPLGRQQPAFAQTKIPMLGVASGGNRGDFVLTDTVVGFALRPAALENVNDVYGIRIRGESMIPRWYPNEPVFASAVKEPIPGDFVVVQLISTNGDREGLVKQLVRMDTKEIVLRALNPPDSKPFKIPMSEVEKVHRVFTHSELHGV